MNDGIQSLQEQLAELEENSRLLRERKSQYVLKTDIPLQLIKDERRLEAQIVELRARLGANADDLETVRAQLAALEVAQQGASDPRRFQLKIDELRAMIANWDERVEMQRQRIAVGLERQRQHIAEKSAQRRDQERIRVVGQRPLDVADYFKNREREQMQIARLLADRTTRLVSIIGHGGMGKTALACKALRDLERHSGPHTDAASLDGIVYLSTRTAGINLERLFLDCARVLGGEQETRLSGIWTDPRIKIKDKLSHLLEALSGRRYVILLDNMDDLLDENGQLVDRDLQLFFTQCLETSPGVQLLVTSRLALAFDHSKVRFDQQVNLQEGLTGAAGVALLRELDPNGEYGLRCAAEQQLAQVVSLTHGVPRALEVFAGILANDPFASLDDVLEHFYKQEDVVHVLIEENYKRLDSNDRQVIEALAVFKRPVPTLAVDYLLEPFVPGSDVPGIIRRLARTNIVSVNRATKTAALHPIDRDYAYSQLPEEEPCGSGYTRRALERRAADYYVQLRTSFDTWRAIDDLEPQLAESRHRVCAGDYDGACRVLEAIDRNYLRLWGHYARLAELREELVGQLTDDRLEIANLHGLGRAYHPLGHAEQAIKHYEEALDIARRIRDHKAESELLGGLGNVCFFLGHAEQAIKLYREALDIARNNGYREVEGMVLSYLGFFHRVRGYVEHSIGFTEDALRIYDEIGYHQIRGSRLGNLGSAYCDLGQIERAIEFYEEARDSARKIGYPREEGVQEANLGDAYYAQGEVERAMKCYEMARTIAWRIGYRAGEGRYLGSLGQACRATGRFEQAISHYKKALSISNEINDPRGKSYQLLGLGQTLLVAGSLPEARQSCAQARELKVPETSYRAALALGIVLLRLHDPIAQDDFVDAAGRCHALLEKTARLYKPRYTLAAAQVGLAVSGPRWAEECKRAELLAPALEEYQRALENCAAKGVVRDALWHLEMIRAAGIEGLESVFELLESALEQ